MSAPKKKRIPGLATKPHKDTVECGIPTPNLDAPLASKGRSTVDRWKGMGSADGTIPNVYDVKLIRTKKVAEGGVLVTTVVDEKGEVWIELRAIGGGGGFRLSIDGARALQAILARYVGWTYIDSMALAAPEDRA